MKLYVTSDIHLEFGDLLLPNTDNVDVLILSGDICVAKDIDRPDERGDRVKNFFQRVSQDFPHVIYIMGNHEHYHGDFGKSADIIRGMAADHHLHNFHLLDKESIDINGYTFVGGTLWTDFNKGDPLTIQHASWGMNDYKGVRNSITGHKGGIWKFIPEHALEDHHQMMDYLKVILENRKAQGKLEKKVVVVGHHAPSKASTHPRYQSDVIMNGCYSTALDEFIMDHPEIVLWTHGHTHEDFDYMIGTTRVVCNPRGYINYEARADHWTPKLIELDD